MHRIIYLFHRHQSDAFLYKTKKTQALRCIEIFVMCQAKPQSKKKLFHSKEMVVGEKTTITEWKPVHCECVLCVYICLAGQIESDGGGGGGVYSF